MNSGEGSINVALERRKATFNQQQNEKRKAKTGKLQNALRMTDEGITTAQKDKNIAIREKQTSDAKIVSNQETLKTLEGITKEQLDVGNGKVTITINGKTETLDAAGIEAAKTQTKVNIETETSRSQSFENSMKMQEIILLKSQAAKEKLEKQIAKTETSVPTANQIIGSHERRKQNLRETKRNLGKSLSRLSGLKTLKNIGHTLRQYGRYIISTNNAQDEQRGYDTMSSIGRSLSEGFKDLKGIFSKASVKLKPISESMSMALAKSVESKANMWGKIQTLANEDGELKREAKEIKNAFDNLKEGEFISSELKERHGRFLKRIETAKTFVANVAIESLKRNEPSKPSLKLESLISQMSKVGGLLRVPVVK